MAVKNNYDMELIPAIDIIEGKCVRLTQGDYAQKIIYNEDPLEAAKQFEAIGIRRLHLVDLDGAKCGQVVNLKVLEKIAAKTELVIDFGGGIKSDETIRIVFESGAAMAAIGSVAVKDPDMFFSWIDKYGRERILLGADVNNEKIAISGWQEKTDLSVFEFIRTNLESGAGAIFCTDISKDGLLMGPSLDLYKKIMEQFPEMSLIASGGVTSVKDLDDLKMIGCSGAIIGKALYEGRISFTDLKKFID